MSKVIEVRPIQLFQQNLFLFLFESGMNEAKGKSYKALFLVIYYFVPTFANVNHC